MFEDVLAIGSSLPAVLYLVDGGAARIPRAQPHARSILTSAELRKPTVALAVTGSISAYKAVEVARGLLAAGARVLPVMTPSACRFLAPLTLSAICNEPVAVDLFDPSVPGERHVEIARQSDLVLVCPASADALARLAQGRADDLVSALALCARSPVLVAPAMHARMWNHPATRRNLQALTSDGVRVVGPVVGALASGEHGMGRLADPAAIVNAALACAGDRSVRTAAAPNPPSAPASTLPGGQDGEDLAGMRVVVTAGPTVEDFDAVRFLSNRSSGRMGFALAERARSRGAQVTLITGPVSLAADSRVLRVDVRSAMQMRGALVDALGPDLSGADALIMAAAVSDYRPLLTHEGKLKKGEEQTTIELVKNPDLIAEFGKRRTGRVPVLVAFALESGSDDSVLAYAKRKLLDKRVDFVVANHAEEGFGGEDNRAVLVDRDAVSALPSMTKGELSDRILDKVRAAWCDAETCALKEPPTC